MRKIIENQLKSVNFADLSHYDKTTGIFTIPKYSKPKFEIGKMYLIQVDNELVDNTNSVIATNWNNCTAPKSAYLKIYINKMQGKMIYVDSLVFNMLTKTDTSTTWAGWLPVDQIKQLEKY
jgi:hypothetical protein